MLKPIRLARSPYWLLAVALISSIGFSRAVAYPVIINEVMYHPPLDLDDLQYIELFNSGEANLDLSRWSFSKGVKFVFPENVRIPAGGYLVICRSRAALLANYDPNIPVAGEFTGKLSHRGEKLELADAAGKVIDTVQYSDQPPWPSGCDGHSASLERISPLASGMDVANWAGSALPVYQKPAGTPGRKNESFSAQLPPAISQVQFKPPLPLQKTIVTAKVADLAGVRSVSLLWRTAQVGGQTVEAEIPMQRVNGTEKQGSYQATLEGVPAGTLVRFRIKAVNGGGLVRVDPSPNEPRPTYSFAAVANTNSAKIAFAYALNVSRPRSKTRIPVWNQQTFQVLSSPTRGNGAFIYMPPEGGPVQTFDHVYLRGRSGGFKVHFEKDQLFKGMTGINVIFEGSPRWLLSEPMSYELYRAAGVPAPLTEHMRVWLDGRLLGYQLLIEQPNKTFLARNQRPDTGYLYKATWMGNNLIGQHMKRTRLASTHDDLVSLQRGVTRQAGPAQWEFIKQNFNVDEFVNYYAVNMCIQNWDGFFNNHFLYHDIVSGKWEMYPWDEDKTWGDYDGASPRYDWYTMPLNFGMGTEQPGRGGFGGFGGMFGGGGSWWRPPGWFSGPLLANYDFRKSFIARLRDLCTNLFTEEKMIPVIDALEKRLEPEIPLRARVTGEDAGSALRRFRADIESLRNQVKYRRKFILSEIPKDRAAR